MKNVTARDVVNFVKEHIVYRFGIPQTITTDQGTIFIAEEFKKFAKHMGITLIQSSPYYAQANGPRHHTMRRPMGRLKLPTRA